MERFTTWLSEKERSALEEQAAAYGTSMNYVARLAIRAYLGLSVPDNQMAWQRPIGITADDDAPKDA